jgi:hypothetical protein
MYDRSVIYHKIQRTFMLKTIKLHRVQRTYRKVNYKHLTNERTVVGNV